MGRFGYKTTKSKFVTIVATLNEFVVTSDDFVICKCEDRDEKVAYIDAPVYVPVLLCITS